MRFFFGLQLWAISAVLLFFGFFGVAAYAGTVTVSSPRSGSTVVGAVPIVAWASENTVVHLELWDNGQKLGDVFSNAVNTMRALPQGRHTLTVLAVTPNGQVLNRSSATYNVSATTPGVAPGGGVSTYAAPVSPTVNGSATSSGVSITSPQNGSAVGGVATIAASAVESSPIHLELWDNGQKLEDVFANSVNTTRVMQQGGHTLTVLAVSPNGQVLNRNSVVYSVSPQSSAAPPVIAPPTTTSVPQGGSNPGNAGAGGVAIASPTQGSTSISAVRIAAQANQSVPVRMEIWDNGDKLGEVAGNNVDGVYVLPNGQHALTVMAIDGNGSTLSSSSVNYTVAEDCSNAGGAPCDLDQIGIDNGQNQCNPRIESVWVANPCGGGVQGTGGAVPRSTLIEGIQENGGLANQGNRTLNGRSVHFQEVQGGSWSNVLFRGTTPTPLPASAIDTHWSLDEYVYLPDPTAHQAFEVDAQYSAGGIWSKFYTECAFNMSNGTGYWAVFDSNTGGWIFLNGRNQGGQTPPVVTCNRSQFAQPWPGSSDPSFTGWHHIAWTFVRRPDGTVTFGTLTFDGTTTQVNFTPNSASGGRVGDNGNYSALVQLDGMYNGTGQHNVVDAYVSEMHLTHTP